MCPFPLCQTTYDPIITKIMADSTTTLIGASGPPRAPNQFHRYFMSKPCVRSSKALNDQDRGYCLLHHIKRHQMLIILCPMWLILGSEVQAAESAVQIVGDYWRPEHLDWPGLAPSDCTPALNDRPRHYLAAPCHFSQVLCDSSW